jgi:hypothetical protein
MTSPPEASWGCQWFHVWKEKVSAAVALKQRLKVVFFPGQVRLKLLVELGEYQPPFMAIKTIGKIIHRTLGISYFPHHFQRKQLYKKNSFFFFSKSQRFCELGPSLVVPYDIMA